jgi:hypothetical protein
MHIPSHLPLLSLLFLRFLPALCDGSSPQSITAAPPFSALKTCAQNCLITQTEAALTCGYDPLGSAIGCNSYNGNCRSVVWPAESCYCRSDLQTAGLAFLSSCVSSRCSVGAYTVDLASVTSMYLSYCTGHGYTMGAAAAATPASGATASG